MNRIIDCEKLTSDEAYALLDEIPSDGSEISESEDENEIEQYMSVFEDEEDIIEPVMAVNSDSSWESEDELPLQTYVMPKEVLKWTKYTNDSISVQPFVELVGPNIPDDLEYPVDVFLALFPQSLLENIVFQTNLYIIQKHGRNNIPTTVEEIKCFFAINLIMGIKKLPSYRDFWSSKMEMRDNFISSVMSRDRFGYLLTHLHLNDNTLQPKKGEPGYDKLYKVKPVLEELSNTYKMYYRPTKYNSIDESMIKFKGRSSFRQYMPLKPIKRGYKVWVRADETGFISQFQIYTGKVENVAEQNLGARVIRDLTRDLVGKYYEVYFDNYFNSVQLQRDLLKDGIYACGTARKGRKEIPIDFKKEKKMKRGDFDWRINQEGILALQWMDRKPILFLSNFHSPNDETEVQRKQKNGSKETVKCLKLVKDYNRHMGYVDKSDMLKACYELDRKSKKWWHRIFWHFLDLTVVNAFILFKSRLSGTGMALKDFKLAVATGLIGAEGAMPQKNRKTSTDNPAKKFKVHVPLERRTDKVAHLPEHGTKVRCANCSTKAKPHRTRWHCKSCHVGLCLTDKQNCFIKFHEK